MQEKQLSQRLQEVAAFVTEGARLLDVGSDHAYLPIYLVESGRIAHAIAGEVVQGPFQSAQSNVSAHGLTDAIEVRLANGLAAFEPADQIDTIVVAGMGGRLIADILAGGGAKLNTVQRLVLQPNNREDDLRRWLADNGWKLVTERIMEEAGKIYEILVAEQGHMELTERELRFGPFLQVEQNTVFQSKWETEYDKLTYALEQVPTSNQEARLRLEHKMTEIKEVLHASK